MQALSAMTTGRIVWAALSAAGVAALLAASAPAFMLLKLVGGAISDESIV